MLNERSSLASQNPLDFVEEAQRSGVSLCDEYHLRGVENTEHLGNFRKHPSVKNLRKQLSKQYMPQTAQRSHHNEVAVAI